MELVGHVQALWRYPVKSMLGERLQQLEVDRRGVVGDRAYALWDPQALRVASAKSPRRSVTLLDQAPAGASLDQYWPQVEGRAFQDVTNELMLPQGTFFDACPIHAISTATLAIGDNLVLRVDGGCPRCVITTLAQGSLPESLEILRATARHNQVTAGIRLSVVQPGPLAVGDPVRLQVG